jgi:hypothetical protein
MKGIFMFNKDQEEYLKRFVQYTLDSLIPLHQQEACGSGKDFWCCDWWSIEVIKCLFLGIETYEKDPPPRRLLNNHNFSKEQIEEDCRIKLKLYQYLLDRRDLADVFITGEAGRGIEIALASLVKPWKKILCYDSNALYGPVIVNFFRGRHNLPVEFIPCSTLNYPFETIDSPYILSLSHSRSGEDTAKRCQDIPNAVGVVINGEIRKGG